MTVAYRKDETPVCHRTPEVGGLGADRAVEEGLERRRHGERFLQGFTTPDHTASPSIYLYYNQLTITALNKIQSPPMPSCSTINGELQERN